MKKVIEVSSKRMVTGGPMLWVSQLLHLRGSISSHKIWDEYQKDTTLEDRTIIKSKNHLKEKILPLMMHQGKIMKAPAQDLRPNKKHGWAVVPNKAFKKIDPVILAQMKPLPVVYRHDYKEYLRNNDIEHEF